MENMKGRLKLAQKNNIVIEIPHPLEQLNRICKAINDIADPGASLEKIEQSTMVFKEADFLNQIFKTYVRYLKFQVKVMEKKIPNLGR